MIYFTAHTFKCVCHCRRAMFRVLGMYNFERRLKYYKVVHFSSISRVFLLRQLWIVNYYVKSSSNNLSNENINTGVSVVFKTECESKCQNELFLKYHLSGNTSIHY